VGCRALPRVRAVQTRWRWSAVAEGICLAGLVAEDSVTVFLLLAEETSSPWGATNSMRPSCPNQASHGSNCRTGQGTDRRAQLAAPYRYAFIRRGKSGGSGPVSSVVVASVVVMSCLFRISEPRAVASARRHRGGWRRCHGRDHARTGMELVAYHREGEPVQSEVAGVAPGQDQEHRDDGVGRVHPG
jgi:hypothetical protein